MSFLVDHEPQVRLAAFLGVFTLVALAEVLWPRRALTVGRGLRWASNLGIVFLNTALLRVVAPVGAVGLATWTAAHGGGLLNQLSAPAWVRFALAVVAMDLVIYLQHVLFHATPALWRLHRVHHADLDYDVTTGARFHPVEIGLSMLIKAATILALGPSPAAVIAFEVLLNASAMFNHGNVRLPAWLDAALRLVLVTPDMHRVHHSVVVHETNRNFGFALPWWDRIFGTYAAQPAAGHEAMEIGLTELRDPAVVDRLPGMLWLPLDDGGQTYSLRGE